VLFAAQCGNKLDPNALTLRLQRTRRISCVSMASSRTSTSVARCGCLFSYNSEFGAYTPEAYGGCCWKQWREMRRCSSGDEVEAAWAIVIDPQRLGRKAVDEPGILFRRTWGGAADDLLAATGHVWRDPQPVTRRNCSRAMGSPSCCHLSGCWPLSLVKAASSAVARTRWRDKPQPGPDPESFRAGEGEKCAVQLITRFILLVMAFELFVSERCCAGKGGGADWFGNCNSSRILRHRALSGDGSPNIFHGDRAAGCSDARCGKNLFQRVHFFWADERCVPPSDPESNYAMHGSFF